MRDNELGGQPNSLPPTSNEATAGWINTDSGLASATDNPWTKNLPNVGEVGLCHAGRPQGAP